MSVGMFRSLVLLTILACTNDPPAERHGSSRNEIAAKYSSTGRSTTPKGTITTTGTATASSGQTIGNRYTHQGTVINAATGQAIAAVTANAYAQEIEEKGGPCPAYKGFLHTANSDQKGGFELSIPTDHASYYVTYCHPAYVTRTAASDNRKPDLPVLPHPVRLWPRAGGTKEMVAAIERVTEQSRMQSFAAREQNALQYAHAAKTLPEPEQRLLSVMIEGDSKGFQQKAMGYGNLEYGGLHWTFIDYRATLQYFYRADAKAFDAALFALKGVQRYVKDSYLREEELRRQQLLRINYEQ